MGWKPGSVKREELENKIRAEDAAKEAEVVHKAAEVRQNRPVSMQPDGAPAKGHTEGSMTQWMFTVSNQLSEMGNVIREVRTLLQTLTLQANRGVISKEREREIVDDAQERIKTALDPKKLEKTTAEVLANNKPKANGEKKAVVDVPSNEVLAAALGKYIKRHGRAAAETRLAQYKVKKAGELSDEQKPLFLQDISA